MADYLAIDMGASNCRHMAGRLRDGRMELQEIYRFNNDQLTKDGTLCWDIGSLRGHIMAGMRECAKNGIKPESMGVDTWGVDFVLLDENERVLGDAVAYRDKRTTGMDESVERRVSFDELYGKTGIQKMPFNTIYQLEAMRRKSPELLERARHLLFMPDYFHYMLTGKKSQEYTIASTSALVNAADKRWDDDLISRLGLPPRLFTELSPSGTRLGGLLGGMAGETGIECDVILPASHDTASAFLAVPARDGNAAYISSGTWSLLGAESVTPVISPDSRAANFTNEGGYAFRYRFLKNIMGLWMIQSVRRDENKAGRKHSFAELERMARGADEFPTFVDVNDDAFFAPDNMTEAIVSVCEREGKRPPKNLPETLRCVYQSLAASYRDAIRDMERVMNRKFTSINVVGGGCKDTFLNELTADYTGLPVYVGPVEGAVIGNLLAQMLAAGEFRDVADARKSVAESFGSETYLPGAGKR
ncbi:MAG: rhamnulokinase [Synergistaceae bacterium]|jgi:rhamnulokinase|nr:rhamnulokinase [Synergistaceae bacterium]